MGARDSVRSRLTSCPNRIMNVGRPAQHCVLLRADEAIEKQAAAMVA